MVPFVYSFKQVLSVWKVFLAKMSPKQNIDKTHHYFEKVEEEVVNSLNSILQSSTWEHKKNTIWSGWAVKSTWERKNKGTQLGPGERLTIGATPASQHGDTGASNRPTTNAEKPAHLVRK